MSSKIDAYGIVAKQKFESEKADWQIKFRKMESERLRLVCEVESMHQAQLNSELERDQMKARVAEIEELFRKQAE